MFVLKNGRVNFSIVPAKQATWCGSLGQGRNSQELEGSHHGVRLGAGSQAPYPQENRRHQRDLLLGSNTEGALVGEPKLTIRAVI